MIVPSKQKSAAGQPYFTTAVIGPDIARITVQANAAIGLSVLFIRIVVPIACDQLISAYNVL